MNYPKGTFLGALTAYVSRDVLVDGCTVTELAIVVNAASVIVFTRREEH